MPIWLEGHPENYQKAVMKSLKQDFLIVPKPSSNNLDSEWSLHFPFAEKMILRNTKCAKPVIKLLKVKYHRLSKVSILYPIKNRLRFLYEFGLKALSYY